MAKFTRLDYTEKLVAAFVELNTDDVLTYSDLTRIAGVPILNGSSPYLFSAIRIAKRDHDIVIGNVRKVGYRRLSDVDIVSSGKKGIKSMHRVAKRTVETLRCVNDYESLPDSEKRSHNNMMGIAGAISLFTSDKGIRKVDTIFGERRAEIPLEQTLALFANK